MEDNSEGLLYTEGQEVAQENLGKVTLRPVTSSRSFTRISSIVDHSVVAKDASGEEQSETAGEYTKERFYDSKQGFRPEFDSKLGQFDIRHTGTGKLWTPEDARKCLEIFPLNYEKGPRKGEQIDKVNIRDVDDVYFNHRGFVRIAEEGFLILDTNDPAQKALMEIYSGNGEVSMDEGQEYLPGDTRYLISNPKASDDRVEQKMQDIEDATELFKTMKDDEPRMIGILRLFGETPDPELSRARLRKALFKYVMDDQTTDSGATYQKRFITYGSLTPEQLRLREVIQLGLNEGEITKRAGTYMFADTPVGRAYSEVVAFFDSGKNGNALGELKMRLKLEE